MNFLKVVNLRIIQNLGRFNQSLGTFSFRNGFTQVGLLLKCSNVVLSPASNNAALIKRSGISTASSGTSLFSSNAEKLFFEIDGRLSGLIDSGQLYDVDLHDEFLNIHFYLEGELSTIVISKQPATRQIWYSSPLRKPDYFDLDLGWKSSRTNKTIFEVLHDDLLQATGIHVKF
ncbi:frataxin like protein [Cryptosporidium canis]|uniref:Frataxin like protein n=1 Tax=Cryptosporidium canis TaxID=195482 RepID=A0A9D5DGD5_9CRYT|nr:frataxin like protein [Cryptosporidium canis]